MTWTYKHQGLIAVFEEGKVLELNKPYRDVFLVHEEASEQHKRNNQHRCQCHCQLLVREDRGDDKCVAASSAIDQDQDTHYSLVKKSVISYRKVGICE